MDTLSEPMRPARRWSHSAVAIVALAGVAAAIAWFGLQGVSPAPRLAMEKLRFALPRVPQAAIVHMAMVKGFFADEGLDIVVVPTSHGVAAMGSMVQGEADLAIASEVPFVISVIQGQALGMAASLVDLPSDNTVIARRDRGIATPADLAGKKIGVSFGSSGSYALWAFLIRHRIAPESVTLVDTPPDRIVAALVGGSVDAVATWEPISSEALTAVGRNAVPFSDPDAYRTTVVIVGHSQFLHSHAGEMGKLMRAMLKAEQFMHGHPDETLRLVAEWLQIDVELLRPTFVQLDFKVELQQSLLTTLEDQARWAMARGYAGTRQVPNFLPNLYLDALLAVMPERVTVLR